MGGVRLGMFFPVKFERGQYVLERSMRRGEPVHFGLVCGSCRLLNTLQLDSQAHALCWSSLSIAEAPFRRWSVIATAARIARTLCYASASTSLLSSHSLAVFPSLRHRGGECYKHREDKQACSLRVERCLCSESSSFKLEGRTPSNFGQLGHVFSAEEGHLC